MDRAALHELAGERFPELPLDCAGTGVLGFIESDEWRDWSTWGPTPDQLRIEDYLDLQELEDRTILHIGVGKSSLASRFHRRARAIFGTSVAPAEVERAKSLRLANYETVLHNKHSGADGVPAGPFDFIVDNNPTSFCCCVNHLGNMLELYSDVLAEDGELITDRVGLDWADLPGGNPRWSFSFEDWEAVVATAGLNAYRVDRNVFVASRNPPVRPKLSARLRQLGLKMLRLAGSSEKLARQIARRIRRMLR